MINRIVGEAIKDNAVFGSKQYMVNDCIVDVFRSKDKAMFTVIGGNGSVKDVITLDAKDFTSKAVLKRVKDALTKDVALN